ncbi:uncharacterized protein LOC144440275 isoform X2 [Glandiceps talaboti]
MRQRCYHAKAIRQTTIGRAMCLFILITGLGVGVEHVNAVPVIDVTINRSGDLSIGEIYTLTCMATYGKPAASFRWYRNGSIVFKEDNRSNNKMENDTFTSKSVYNFKVRDEDDGSIVVCEAVQPLITTGKSDSVILTIDIYSNITEITTRNNKVWMVITIVIGVMFVASVIVGWKLFKKYKSQPTPSGQYDMVPRSSPEQTTTSIPHVAISQPSTSGSHTMTSDKTK